MRVFVLAIRVSVLVATHTILLPLGVKLDCEVPRV